MAMFWQINMYFLANFGTWLVEPYPHRWVGIELFSAGNYKPDDDDDQDRLEQCSERFNKECIHYDVDDLEGAAIPEWGQYKVVHHNIQSLSNKFDDLKLLFGWMNSNGKATDAILLSQTFLRISNDNMFHIDGSNFVYRTRTK